MAVLRNSHWISISTRIALSHLDHEPDFLIQPSPDFIFFSADAPLSTRDGLLLDVCTKGRLKLQAEKGFDIFLTLAHANSDQNAPRIQFGTPYSTLNIDHEGRLGLGESSFWLNATMEYQYN